MPEKLTILIPTLNEEENLPSCMASIGDLADELLVLDNYSSDRTVEVARSHNAVIHQRNFDNFSANKNAALPLARNNWVLVVDADEHLTPGLREEIRGLLRNVPEHDAYAIRRDAFVCGKKVRCWSRDWVVRLFRKDKARYSTQTLVHEHLQVQGSIGRLRSPMQHFTFRSFAQYLPKLDAYTTLAAQEAHAKGQRAAFIELFLYPPARFLKTYLLRGGILDGAPGFIIAWLSAYSSFLKFAKLRELQDSKQVPKRANADHQE